MPLASIDPTLALGFYCASLGESASRPASRPGRRAGGEVHRQRLQGGEANCWLGMPLGSCRQSQPCLPGGCCTRGVLYCRGVPRPLRPPGSPGGAVWRRPAGVRGGRRGARGGGGDWHLTLRRGCRWVECDLRGACDRALQPAALSTGCGALSCAGCDRLHSRCIRAELLPSLAAPARPCSAPCCAVLLQSGSQMR